MATAKKAATKRPTKAAAKAPAKRAPRKTAGKVATKTVTPEAEAVLPDDWMATAEILGVSELPAFLGFQRSTVHVWGYRGQLPAPDYPSINGFGAWKRQTILEWAAQTGRVPPWHKKEAAPFEPEGGYQRKRRTKAEIAAADEAA